MWRMGPLHRAISPHDVHCYPAENPGIRVAEVTAGTRCYTVPPAAEPQTMGKSGAPYWRSLARMTSARTARMIEKNPITPST